MHRRRGSAPAVILRQQLSKYNSWEKNGFHSEDGKKDKDKLKNRKSPKGDLSRSSSPMFQQMGKLSEEERPGKVRTSSDPSINNTICANGSNTNNHHVSLSRRPSSPTLITSERKCSGKRLTIRGQDWCSTEITSTTRNNLKKTGSIKDYHIVLLGQGGVGKSGKSYPQFVSTWVVIGPLSKHHCSRFVIWRGEHSDAIFWHSSRPVCLSLLTVFIITRTWLSWPPHTFNISSKQTAKSYRQFFAPLWRLAHKRRVRFWVFKKRKCAQSGRKCSFCIVIDLTQSNVCVGTHSRDSRTQDAHLAMLSYRVQRVSGSYKCCTEADPEYCKMATSLIILNVRLVSSFLRQLLEIFTARNWPPVAVEQSNAWISTNWQIRAFRLSLKFADIYSYYLRPVLTREIIMSNIVCIFCGKATFYTAAKSAQEEKPYLKIQICLLISRALVFLEYYTQICANCVGTKASIACSTIGANNKAVFWNFCHTTANSFGLHQRFIVIARCFIWHLTVLISSY